MNVARILYPSRLLSSAPSQHSTGESLRPFRFGLAVINGDGDLLFT